MRMPPRRAADDGAAAVEFAVVIPLFLVVLLGILAYGIYFGAVHSAAQLAADAARASVAGLSDAERTTIAEHQVQTDVKNYALLDPARVTVVAGPISGDPTSFQVAIHYDASALPIWGVVPFVPMPSKTIVRSATIKSGGY